MEGFVFKTLTVDNLSGTDEWRVIDVYVLLTEEYAKEILDHIPDLVNNNCYGCYISDPSQRGHSCLMDPFSDQVCFYFQDVVPAVDEDKVFKKLHQRAVEKGVIKEENVILLTTDRPCKEDSEFMLAVYNRAHEIAAESE